MSDSQPIETAYAYPAGEMIRLPPLTHLGVQWLTHARDYSNLRWLLGRLLAARDPSHTNKSKVGLARRYRFRTTRRHPYHWPLTERAGVQHQPVSQGLGMEGAQ